MVDRLEETGYHRVQAVARKPGALRRCPVAEMAVKKDDAGGGVT